MDRFNKFWRIRSGIALEDLSKRDRETHNKILGLIIRAEIQLAYLAEERQILNIGLKSSLPKDNNGPSAKAEKKEKNVVG